MAMKYLDENPNRYRVLDYGKSNQQNDSPK